jgi:hypothetical protein
MMMMDSMKNLPSTAAFSAQYLPMVAIMKKFVSKKREKTAPPAVVIVIVVGGGAMI